MRNPADTRERIEQAALELFYTHGIDGTSVGQIAAQAGVSQGALYSHYAGKEELALELFSRGWSEMGAEFRRLALGKKTFREKLEVMIAYVYRRFDKDWAFVAYSFTTRHSHLRRMDRTSHSPYLVFRAVVRDAMNSGEIRRVELDVATAMIMGAIVQVIDTKLLGAIKGPLAPRAGAVAWACANLVAK
jgi:AcrR family transcriptional regulator